MSGVDPSRALDAFLPEPDARERFEITVRAPAALVFDVAAGFDMQTLALVRAIFRLRARLLGSEAPAEWRSGGFLADARRLGWGVLVEDPPRMFAAGASCQPWLPDVTFRPHPPAEFRSFSDPGQVKIAWTLEALPTGPGECRLATETRAAATDPSARRRFLRYWRWARFGILPIRWLLLPAIGREAEKRFRDSARHLP